MREYSDQMNLLSAWRKNDGRYPPEESFSRCSGFSEARIFRMFRRVPEARYIEGFSVHTNPKRSLRAYSDGFCESAAVIHHFHSLKGGGAFIRKKQAARLRNEIRHMRLYPGDHWNHYNVAIGHFSLGHDEEALAAATKAVKLDPVCYRSWLLLGSIRKELRRYKLAERALERCKSIAPRRPEAWILLGMIADADGRAENAEAFLRKALSLDTSHPLALNSLGVVLERLGKLAQAGACYERALKVLPNNSLFEQNMARLKDARQGG
ncbi:MAG: tetratricopeptide repeat protein [Gemmatimonadaceae bacterium]